MILLDFSILSPTQVVFEGTAGSIVVPGEQGVFEVLPFHKRLISRLVSGTISVDNKHLPIKRGLIQVRQNKVTILMEEP